MITGFAPEKLHVVVCISNPARFESRYRLYHQFAKAVLAQGARLYTVEAAFGDRKHEVTLPGTEGHLQLRTNHELWHKENMLNLGISRLPDDWEYVAWVDADVGFLNADWVNETIHQLQHYGVVQLFETAVDLGPMGQAFATYNGFVSCWQKNVPYNTKSYPYWHPGFGWAATREAFESLGGLIDQAILGAADHHQALALVGQAERSLPGDLTPAYDAMVYEWQNKANLHIRQNIGFVPGTVVHHWHGPKKARRYLERWEILQRWKFDPGVDIRKNYQGLYELTHAGLRMRNDLRAYFRQRNEDSIDADF
jgi:hypothetical protein